MACSSLPCAAHPRILPEASPLVWLLRQACGHAPAMRCLPSSTPHAVPPTPQLPLGTSLTITHVTSRSFALVAEVTASVIS
jgi:hypothetical protein